MKKKIITVLAVAMACAALTGCGGNTSRTTSNTSNATSSAATASGSDSSAANSTASTQSATSENGLAAKTAALKEAVKFPEMVSVKADTLKERFGIEEADVSDFSAYVCGSGAMPDEFGVFTAKDTDAAKRIKDALNKRVEQQRKTFQDYTPNEMYKFDDYFVEVNGTSVSYAICADNEKAKELLK